MAFDVVAPMPGRVVEVKVKVGDTVQEDEPVLVLEAMKIEMPIVAEGSGTVKEVLVKPGDTVESEQVLVRVE